MKIDGQCHCGDIAYEAEIDPAHIGICHCTDCQALSASAFRTVGFVKANAFRILRGIPKDYIKVAANGNRRAQAFCERCGTGLYAASAETPRDVYRLRLGTVKQRDALVPRFECWTKSALPWIELRTDTRKFEGNPEL